MRDWSLHSTFPSVATLSSSSLPNKSGVPCHVGSLKGSGAGSEFQFAMRGCGGVVRPYNGLKMALDGRPGQLKSLVPENSGAQCNPSHTRHCNERLLPPHQLQRFPSAANCMRTTHQRSNAGGHSRSRGGSYVIRQALLVARAAPNGRMAPTVHDQDVNDQKEDHCSWVIDCSTDY